jgi:hypothetical protein
MRTARSTSPLKRIIFESLIPAQQRHIAMLDAMITTEVGER